MQKWGGGMAQAVQNLPSKHEALSLNHSAAKKKRKRKKSTFQFLLWKQKLRYLLRSFSFLLICDPTHVT
jgi:hypothetical protein